MKKLIILSLTLLITITTVASVYATSGFEISLQASKNEVNKGEEFVVDVNISNIQMEKGIIALGGKLEYDKESLELVKMEGQNTWARPSYNDSNGKFATDRNDYATSDETIFKITFKVKEQSKQNLTIVLNDVAGSNGKEEAKLNNIKTNITVKNGTANPENPPQNTNTSTDTNTSNTTNTNSDTDNNTINNNTTNNDKNNNTSNNNSTNNQNTNISSNTNSVNNTTNNVINRNIVANTNSSDNVKGGIFPKTGASSLVYISIVILILIAFCFYIRIRIIDSKAKKNNIIK